MRRRAVVHLCVCFWQTGVPDVPKMELYEDVLLAMEREADGDEAHSEHERQRESKNTGASHTGDEEHPQERYYWPQEERNPRFAHFLQGFTKYYASIIDLCQDDFSSPKVRPALQYAVRRYPRVMERVCERLIQDEEARSVVFDYDAAVASGKAGPAARGALAGGAAQSFDYEFGTFPPWLHRCCLKNSDQR